MRPECQMLAEPYLSTGFRQRSPEPMSEVWQRNVARPRPDGHGIERPRAGPSDVGGRGILSRWHNTLMSAGFPHIQWVKSHSCRP